jgi:hypothetical protein
MSLIDRVKNITLRPAAEWPVIAGEPSSLGGLYAGYVAPLAAISPVALFIGLSIVGVSIPFVGTYRTPFFAGVSQAVLSFVFALIGLLLMAAIVNALAPTFGGRRDLNAAFKLVAYSATPSFVAGALSVFPPLAMLEVLAGLWALYVFYVGVPVVMQTTREKALPYTALTMVCAFVVGLVFTFTIGTMFGAAHLAMQGFAPAVAGVSAPGDDGQAKAVAAAVVASALGGDDSNKKQVANLVDSVAQAGKAADAASASGDAGAQAQAGVNVLKALVTGGKGNVKPVPRDELKALLPDSIAGLPRATAQSKTGTFAGIAASGASATYGDGAAQSIELNVGDIGNMGGLAMLANVGANLSSSESDEGYTKTVDVGGRKIHEQWTAAGKHSEVFEIIGDRFAVSVDATGVDMDTAVSALNGVDVDRLAHLAP